MEFSFLEDEKFDFDVLLSPDNGENKEDEEEIFFGPVGHTERCIATNTASQAAKLMDDMETMKALSPLSAEQVVEIFKEATSMAVMLKNCSSDAPSDSEEQNRNKNFPELITDISESVKACERQNAHVEKEPEVETTSRKGDEDSGGFVVRRRALRERNPVDVKSEINSPKSKQLQTPTRSANRKSITRPTKSALTTPKRTSLSTSRAESKSSSASDTSFCEEKTSKVPALSHSGLKVPGFSSRRRTSSNSSTSSTSSIPGTNLNETFTKSNEPSKTSNLKQCSNKQKLSNTKAALTKPITSKPVFAKPSNVPKASKLQPVKAVQTRSLSVAGQGSPARLKSNSRPVSTGTTPLRVQFPKAEGTPIAGTTPIRRRGSAASSGSSMVMRSALNTSAIVHKDVTPQAKRAAIGVPGIAGRSKGTGIIARLPGSSMKSTAKNRSENDSARAKIPSTPDKNTKKNHERTGTPEQKPSKAATSAYKRRSFLPTPNVKTSETKSPKAVSPPPALEYSPDVPNTIERAKNLLKKLEHKSVTNDLAHLEQTSDTCENSMDKNATKEIKNSPNEKSLIDNGANALQIKENSPQDSKEHSENFPHEQQQQPRDYANGTSKVEADSESSQMSTAAVVDGHDLMVQDSPETTEAPTVDVLADPFSPGIDTPPLAGNNVLCPIVVMQDSKDLIDLSYQSPKPEVDLIDFDAKSPLIEAKLVDI